MSSLKMEGSLKFNFIMKIAIVNQSTASRWLELRVSGGFANDHTFCDHLLELESNRQSGLYPEDSSVKDDAIDTTKTKVEMSESDDFPEEEFGQTTSPSLSQDYEDDEKKILIFPPQDEISAMGEHDPEQSVTNFPCKLCSDFLISESERTKHYKARHNIISLPGLLSQLSKGSNFMKGLSKFNCRTCWFGCELREQLDEHMMKIHNAMPVPALRPLAPLLQCGICKERFINRTQLTVHRAKVHGMIKITKQPPTAENVHNTSFVPEQKPAVKLYQCDICKERLRNRRQLIAHKNNVHGNKVSNRPLTITAEKEVEKAAKSSTSWGSKPTACNICKEVFNNWWRMYRHKQSTHGVCKTRGKKETVFENDLCNEKTKSQSGLLEHVLSHKIGKDDIIDSKYLCNQCPSSFPSQQQLDFHGSIHEHDPVLERKSTVILYQCGICKLSLRNRTQLIVHRNNVHGIKISNRPLTFTAEKEIQKTANSSTISICEPNEKQDICLCPVCGLGFTSEQRLTTHNNIVHLEIKPYGCDMCESTFASKSMVFTHKKRKHGLKPFKCDVCDKEFGSHNQVEYHKNADHLLEAPHSCTSCTEKFYSRIHLQRHVYCQHTVKKQYKCFTCKKIFPTLEEHNIHRTEEIREKYKHLQGTLNPSDIPPFVCKTCGKPFGLRRQLKIHSDSHSKERRFKCHLCYEAFTRRGVLRTHVQRVHNETLGHIFYCSCCKENFNTLAELNDHKLEKLRREQERTGKGDMPSLGNYTCSTCDRVFLRRRQFRRHRLSHLGIKNFDCWICGKAFTIRGSLKKHLLRIHVVVDDERLSKMKYHDYVGKNKGRKAYDAIYENVYPL